MDERSPSVSSAVPSSHVILEMGTSDVTATPSGLVDPNTGTDPENPATLNGGASWRLPVPRAVRRAQTLLQALPGLAGAEGGNREELSQNQNGAEQATTGEL